MMLNDERAVKAEGFGLDVVFEKVAEPLRAVEFGTAAPRCGAAKQAKLHRSSFLAKRDIERHYLRAGDVQNTVS